MKKAISPVIATVIIVAVTIAIAIAVALWMTGLVGSFTATENLQIITAYAEQFTNTTTNTTYWTITLQVKNVGTTDVTIDNIFINGKPYGSVGVTLNITLPYSIKTGETKGLTITISSGFSSGQMVEVKLHTASGKEYPKQVTLP
ncbi:archaellin/type IV pilin N-terminal domain-containing protein [Desulfurococcus mucosus]|uniref:DUF4352 domain-containing protein n=1 Tax=Desulfurococcus mucosus (strain ATCC 35584 / DSM 2162 / JCM 9187 / O7/1) TaxID=765177 RepID=E8R891_DESM0|nr:archaellin/type IV pilin N-terminal domain-containing protein [Desulfurococcus mucosus]ADV64717.1 hypothetical protein Desmu_0398 [Desulfurococcus mucosus DSM 2162]